MSTSTNDIINRLKRLITLPQDDTLFQINDYIAFINDCLIEKIYPRLMKTRDDYFLVRDVFNLQNSQGQDLYPTGVMPIPPRAWGNTLKELRYIDISGNYYKTNRYFLEDIDLYQARNLAFSSAYQKGFVPYNSGIKLIPPPLQDNGSIEMYYIITPSIVIPTLNSGDNYAELTNMQFNSLTNIATYTVFNIITNGTIDLDCPVNATRLFDIYDISTGMLLAHDIAMTRTNSTTFTSLCTIQTGTGVIDPSITEITNFQLGGFPVVNPPYDYNLFLVEAGENPFTPVPAVMDNLLIYELAIKILSAQGYVEELQIFMQEHADLRKDLISQMAMRVEDEPQVISNKRGLRSSILYGAMRTRRNT